MRHSLIRRCMGSLNRHGMEYANGWFGPTGRRSDVIPSRISTVCFHSQETHGEFMTTESHRADDVSQGIVRNADGSITFRLWAPRAAAVELVTWPDGDERRDPMQSQEHGYHAICCAVNGASQPFRYAYKLDTFDRPLPDPTSRYQPDGVHQPSAYFDADRYAWSDASWRGVAMRDLAIYELHVGTFTPTGTFDAAASRLAELVDLGITAIELMPVAQFPGDRNWGYDGVHPFAVQNSYGGPEGLQRFVDAAHAHGLGVLLDVVYNHLGPEGNYLSLFGPYFSNRHSTPWGDAVNFDGPNSDPVRRYFLDNARMWIRDFHIDGLRLDAVHAIHDESAIPLLAELRDEVHAEGAACGRSVVVIAESNQNDSRIIRSRACGGFDLDGVWNDDFHHAIHACLTGERQGYYVDFDGAGDVAKAWNDAFVHDGTYSPFRRRRHGNSAAGVPRERFIVNIQTHDQVGNRPRGDRLSMLVSPEALRLSAALLLLSPYTPLLFMGEEYGETRSFPFFASFLDESLVEAVRSGRAREFAVDREPLVFDVSDPHSTATRDAAVLGWDWANDAAKADMRKLYRTLLHVRRADPPLFERESMRASFAAGDAKVLVLRSNVGTASAAVANLSDTPLSLDGVLGERCGTVFSTSHVHFGGKRTALQRVDVLEPYELIVTGDEGCRIPLL